LPYTDEIYDVAIIGGGLAGLSVSISLAERGAKVILFEKERYPFHRVCGEYISMESWPFLERIGIPLSALALPVIRRLTISAPDGYTLSHPLEPGGFGISRFFLDNLLAEKAKARGVDLRISRKVTGLPFDGNCFEVRAGDERVAARVVVGSFGKRSNLDVQMKRPFILRKGNKLDNYIGIKYHLITALPRDLIALHNFENGYCGVSAVENGHHCLCYLTTAANLEKCDNNLTQLQRRVLSKNPHLKDIFEGGGFEWEKPESIAQISFASKSVVEHHALMTGDAAGMISPLCGNGMTMAFQSGQLAQEALLPFLAGKVDRETMEKNYQRAWEGQFGARLKAGRIIQSLFGRPWTTKLFLQLLSPFPKFTSAIIRSTHGSAF
jgi:menaquinone-9 beta-reductase